MTKPWYHAPKGKDGWPLWVPDLWAEDFERKSMWQWRFDLFCKDVPNYRFGVYSEVLRAVPEANCGDDYHSIEGLASPSERAVMWKRLRIKLGYTELHYVDAV